MPQELSDLIQKIQEEGVATAERKAQDIEEEAKHAASEIVQSAKKEAQGLISEAKQEISRIEKGGEESLKQSGRNLLLTLKKEISSMLDRFVVSDVRKALSPDDLTKILTQLIKNSQNQKDIIVSVSKEDREKLEKGFLSGLKEEVKKGITLKRAEDIRGGFIISFDKGKSHFDFTDAALAAYIASFLKPKLALLLKDAASGSKKGSAK